ncbi:hypothetical protein QZH41_020353 [Actinostola sp. cb2023]|nr:hypothetical protein QZH41_020353 [Actinostola sp. cb2023]
MSDSLSKHSSSEAESFADCSGDNSSSENEGEVLSGVITPYANEPLASSSDSDSTESDNDDEDGISPATLEARFEGQAELNDLFCRAVAYRWLIKWICGYLGWENRRPLPACIYHDMRIKYPGHHTVGYAQES